MVPKGWAEDPRLGSWVKPQRAGKMALDRGEPSAGMTAERAARLAALGFAWEPTKHSSANGAKRNSELWSKDDDDLLRRLEACYKVDRKVRVSY
jgi:hypothetical protein